MKLGVTTAHGKVLLGIVGKRAELYLPTLGQNRSLYYKMGVRLTGNAGVSMRDLE